MARTPERAALLLSVRRSSAAARWCRASWARVSRHARLCHVPTTGHAPPEDEVPGHDLTYLAAHGLVSPPALPRTLFADMAGAERAGSIALALVVCPERPGKAPAASAPRPPPPAPPPPPPPVGPPR